MKRILLSFALIIVIIAFLGGIKALQIKSMIDAGEAMVMPPLTVTTAQATRATWEQIITVPGSLEAAQGIVVRAELSGKIVDLPLKSGVNVKKGQVLLRQDTASERARLRSIEAQLMLAQTTVQRAKKLLASQVIPQSEYDNAFAQAAHFEADAEALRVTIRKKTIRAPFNGRLGITSVNLGQLLAAQEKVVGLQSLTPIRVNANVPQRQISRITKGMTVRVSGTGTTRPVAGKISAISPHIDEQTRMLKIQATLTNKDQQLRPGMFVEVSLIVPTKRNVISIPQTAVLSAPYGDSVFVVVPQQTKGAKRSDTDENPRPQGKVASQRFVRLGERRGDFVAVTKGLSAGATVVSSGVFKMRDRQAIVVDNTLEPNLELNPKPDNN